MKKSIIVLCGLTLVSCTTGTKEVENKHWAYVHQVIEQSQKQKVVLANVGDISTINQQEVTARGVKLILENCQYEDEWIDSNTYIWTGKLENTHKSFTYTTGFGTQRTVPVYTGDCTVGKTKMVDCVSWETGCIIDSKSNK